MKGRQTPLEGRTGGLATPAALEHLPLPVMLADRTYTLTYANRAAIALQADDPTGKPCYRVFRDYEKPCRVPLNECPIRSFYETGETLTVLDNCLSSQPLSSFAAGNELVGLLVGTAQRPNLEDHRLIHTGKMAALGAMLVHIVHNLNSSFYVSGNYLNVLKKKLTGEIKREDILHYLELIDNSNRLASDMTRTLLDYTRTKASEQQIDARAAVEEVCSLFTTSLAAADIEATITGTDQGPVVNRHALLTVLFCLIQNAIEAMPGGGGLEIAINDHSVTISDQGRGIPPEIKEKLFTPYFTTSSTGTGLGLLIADRMMQAMDGEIAITGAAGTGTTVKLLFRGGKNENSGG